MTVTQNQQEKQEVDVDKSHVGHGVAKAVSEPQSFAEGSEA